MKTQVKTAKGRKLSSTRWLHRHINDKYVQKVTQDGYRSRSAYKLIEIDNKFKLLRNGKKIIDLGAYPGGWSQVALQKVKDVFAVDIRTVNPIDGVKFIQCDVVNEFEALKIELSGQNFDLVLSDMAPNSCGLQSLDHIRIMILCEAALKFAEHFLNIGGNLVIKVFQGESDKDFCNILRSMFKTVRYFKPKASRSESAEIYLVNLHFVGFQRESM